MELGFALAILLALAFAVTNGLHDASNAIATLVATRAARPLQAIVLATVFNLLGPLLVGAAVADTIGGIVTVEPAVAAAVIGSGLAAAVAWNLITWRFGIPSSSGHALVGGLVGAAMVEGGHHRGPVGRPRWLAPGGRVRRADRARDLAAPRRTRWPDRDPWPAPVDASCHPALEGSGPRR